MNNPPKPAPRPQPTNKPQEEVLSRLSAEMAADQESELPRLFERSARNHARAANNLLVHDLPALQAHKPADALDAEVQALALHSLLQEVQALALTSLALTQLSPPPRRWKPRPAHQKPAT